ncbi:MAG: class I SAM-dependent methyltransferase [Pseudomonadota bacterium]|nr:class I SAM-dependent methyltransferase [Pseudomonadota bacterium]
MDDWSLPRENLNGRRAEAFRPPAHARARSLAGSLLLAARRLADLQYGSIQRDLARLLPAVRGSIADVGCGAQPFRDLLPPSVRYIGTDIAESEARFGYRVPDTRYYQGERLPLADREVDHVLCTETLEHVPEPLTLLRELARIVVPGGRLILTVPFAARWHFVPHDYWRFTPSGLDRLLAQAGFRDIRVYPRGGALAVAGYKALGWVLIMLSGGSGTMPLAARLIGVCALPLAALAALAGNLGLAYPGSAEDTLGYTVLAVREDLP